MIRISGATFKEKRLMRSVERACYATLSQQDIFTVDLTVVDGETIRALNSSARGVDRVTDVLSFPCFEGLKLPVAEEDFSDCDYDGKRVMLGSIMICRERAGEQAEEFGHSYARELGFLTCHGLLHLLGFDHIEKEDEEVMTAHQREIMDKNNRHNSNLCSVLFRATNSRTTQPALQRCPLSPPQHFPIPAGRAVCRYIAENARRGGQSPPRPPTS